MELKEFNKTLKAMVTPKGVAVYPWLSKAKLRVGKKEIDPTFTTDLRLDPQDAGHKKFLDALTAVAEEGKALLPKSKQKEFRMPIIEELDKETEEETGFVIVRAKTYATAKDGSPKKLTIVDAKKNAVTQPVFGGSELKLIIKPSIYSGGLGNGCTLYLNAVQVITLVTSGGADTSLFDEEDGFEADVSFADESSAVAADGDDSDY